MATQTTKRYLRIRPDGTQESLYGGTSDDDAMRYAREGYVPTGGIDVTVGTPPVLVRQEWPREKDWGDGKRGGASGATGRELDEAGMLGTGPDVDVREGTPSLVSRTPERAQDWSDGKMSGASNPRARAPSLSVGPSSTSPSDAGYLERLKAGATLPGKGSSPIPFGDDELSAMFEGGKSSSEEGDPELEAAQGRGQDTRLAAAIGRAGAQFNESLTGAKFDRTAYDGYAAEGDRPVGELLQRREAVAQRQGRARTAQQDRMRAEEHAREYARQRENDAYGRKRDAAGDARYAAEQAESARRFGLSRQDAAANRALQRQSQNDTRALANQQRVDAARAKAQEVADRNAEKDRQELAKRAGVSGELRDDIGTLNSAITRGRESWNGDIPGLGVWDSWKMTNPAARALFASPEDIEVSEAVDRLSGNENRAMTGLSSTDSERRENKRRRGLDAGNTEEAAVQGISTLARDATTKLRGVEGGFNQDVVDEYRRRGGGTSADIPAPLSTRPTAAPVVMLSPDGRQYTVDPSEVDEAQQNGWRLK